MNYFPFHVGDYVASTAHLSWDEDMAYTRLIRIYYQTEKPIPKDKAYRLARATTVAQKAAVDSVLEEFFVLDDTGAYRQTRCDEEIAKFCDKQSKAKRSADARWGHHQTQSDHDANAMRTHSDGNANQEPRTNNQEPKKDAGKPASSKSSQVAFATYLESCKAAGIKPIPEKHYVRTYCVDAGISNEMRDLAWLRFKFEHTSGQRKTKRYTDWPDVFGHCVKDNWYKFWIINAEGPANWTTSGIGERKSVEAQQARQPEPA